MRSLSRFCAILLIALAVSPVTAPFAAYDVTAMITEDGGLHCDAKDLKESTTLPMLDAATPRLELGAVICACDALSLTPTRSTAPPILRL
jgi:hypothetical protein